MKHLLSLLLSLITTSGIAQKEVYLPAYIRDTNTVDGSQFSWDKTLESANFILIWGDSAGIDPLMASHPDLAFNPAAVLDTMERIYQAFVDFGFARDTAGTSLHQYKIPIMMLNTFGPTGVTGWAFGGDIDGVVGAFWSHPLAMQTGHVAAHEFAHALQAQNTIDYRTEHGLGPVWLNAGIFWETHANFMRNLLYPQDVSAWGMDLYHVETWGDWKNTYENYQMLMAMHEAHGIDIVNRLWRESFSNEYPLQTYKRILNLDQGQFNDKMYNYARRMATYDFNYGNVGSFFRQYRSNDLMYSLPSAQATWTILEQDSLEQSHYRVPVELAPEEFAYNVIPLYPDPDSCAVLIRFKGHTNANVHAGWRYGFVAADADGIVTRYSETYAETDLEIHFSLLPDEAQLYFVVMGAPDEITTNASNDTWHGYPKHFRFPYELSISGAAPEGHQDPSDFRVQLKGNGHVHPNGGGWVDNNSTVASTVFVGPHAIVLGNSSISGNVRIENTAIVRDALISGDVVIKDNALVIGGILSDSARIGGQALSENNHVSENTLVHMRARVSNYKLHGDIEVGGDVIVYNNTGDCDNGVYYRMTNFFQDNLLECDGRDANHPANLDVNNAIIPFTNAEMAAICNCSNYPDCETTGIFENAVANDIILYPNPASASLTIDLRNIDAQLLSLMFYNALGSLLHLEETVGKESVDIDVSSFPVGVYTLCLTQKGKQITVLKCVIQR